MAAPTLQAYLGMLRGDLTLPGSGVVAISQFVLVSNGGSAITSWSWTISSGTAGHWTTYTNGNSPTPSSAGHSALLNAGPYIWNVTATNADGTSNTVQVKITIQADSYTVSQFNDCASTVNGLRQLAIRYLLGGKTIRVAKNTGWMANGGSSINSALTASFQLHTEHSGRILVTSEDTTDESTWSTLGQMAFYGCQRIDIEKLKFELYMSPAVGGGKGSQILNALNVGYATGLPSDDFTIRKLRIGAPASANDPSQWISGIGISGNAASPFQPTTNINIVWDGINDDDRVIMTRVCNGIVGSTINNCDLDGYVVDRFCSNATFIGGHGVSDNRIHRVVECRGYNNPRSPGDHRDSMQIGSVKIAGETPSNYNNNQVIDVLLIQADGDVAPQGYFSADVSSNGGVATGVFQNGQVVQNVYSDFVTFNAPSVDAGTGIDMRWNTSIRGPQAYMTGAIGTPRIVFGTQGVSGVVELNAYEGRNATNFSGGNAAYDAAPNATIDLLSTPPAGTSSSWNEAARIAYYAPYFNDPGRVIDYPNLTALEIAAEIKIAYRAKLNGGLKITSGPRTGQYYGAWFPDGSLNDGTVYGQSAPTLISLSVLDANLEANDTTTVMYQLDAPATVAVTVTFTQSGSGTVAFANPTGVIGIGETSTSVDIVATGVGTCNIGCTNNRSLTNPAALVVTITSPAVVPTLYTQVGTPPSPVVVGQPITILYTLDHPAVADTTVTCTATGPSGNFFSGNTTLIPFGQSTGQVIFTPNFPGTLTFTAADDQGLTDPAALVYNVTNVNFAQMVVLGIQPLRS